MLSFGMRIARRGASRSVLARFWDKCSPYGSFLVPYARWGKLCITSSGTAGQVRPTPWRTPLHACPATTLATALYRAWNQARRSTSRVRHRRRNL